MEFINKLSQASNSKHIIEDLTMDQSGTFDLGVLFLTLTSEKDVKEIINGVKGRIPVKNMLACTCAGIIGSHVELENQPAASLMLANLNDVKISPFTLNQTQLEGMKVKEDWYNFFEIYPSEDPVFFVLPDPFSLDMNTFLKCMNEAYAKNPIVGGLASGAYQPYGNTFILNEETFNQGMVGFVLTGNLIVDTVVSQGCRPIGDTYIVTKAVDNIIHEIAGKKFLDVLKGVMDNCNSQDQMLFQQAAFVGIAMDEYKQELKRGDFLIRGLMGVDQQTGAGYIADAIRTGQTIQFQVRDAKAAMEDLNELLKHQQSKLQNKKPKGAFVFTCNGRGEGLFAKKNYDIETMQNHLGPIPAAGFFCAGEIGSIGNQNFLHGFTNSMALFYPKT